MLYIKCISIFQHNSSPAADRQRRNLSIPTGVQPVVVYDVQIIALPWIETITDIGVDFIREAVVLYEGGDGMLRIKCEKGAEPG